MYHRSDEPGVLFSCRRNSTPAQMDNMFTFYDEATNPSDQRIRQADLNAGVDYLEEHNVRIYPRQIIFTNPFEGKLFKEQIVIRNSGKRPVLVRILTPSSSGIQIKTIRDGFLLCAGLSITRTVKYKVQMMTAIKSCFIPIFIDDEYSVDYPVRIMVTPVNLRIMPANLNFGQVDVSESPIKRTIIIYNTDVKPAHFFIDLGPNELSLSADPGQGTVLGEHSVEVCFTVTFPYEGNLQTEFWIISEISINVLVKAIVGIPSIVPRYVPHTPSFTFIQFPVTYYGTTVVRSVIMQNTSIMQSFFCVVGERDMEMCTLQKLRSEIYDYNYFQISPEEGRLLPNDVRVFQFTYAPVVKKAVPKQPYHLVVLRIKRLKCKDINPVEYSQDVFEETRTQPRQLLAEGRRSSGGKGDAEIFNLSSLRNFSKEMDLKRISMDRSEKLNSMELRLLLYGQVEKVAVSIHPDAITLSKADVDQTTARVFHIQNNCALLPIIFRYKKIAFVEVEPKIGHLGPLQSVEVKVLITPRSYYPVDTNIVFEFLYYNQPRLDQDLVVVGKCKIPFILDEKIVTKNKLGDPRLAKNFIFKKPNQRPNDFIMNILMRGNIYIALPDDRPTNNMSDPHKRMFKSIYAALPRYQPKFDKYALTSREEELLDMRNYYNIYIKTEAKKKKLAVPESIDLLKYPEQCQLGSCVSDFRESVINMTKEFIPLTPLQLVFIDVQPRSTVVENVAFDSTYTHTLKVINGSNSFLNVYLRAHNPAMFDFYNGNRFKIPPHTEQSLSFIIFVGTTPVHSYEIHVLINNAFVIETSILVKARSKHLTMFPEKLSFVEDGLRQFVELHNDLNVNIPFLWKVPAMFHVDPCEGEVVAGRFVACMITFDMGSPGNLAYDLDMYTDNKFSTLKVVVEPFNYKVKLPKVLNFDEIPMNIPCTKTLPLSNGSTVRLFFEIYEQHLLEGIKVKPKDGYINAFGTVHLAVCANRSLLGAFNAKIEVMIAKNIRISCEASGTVSFPELKFRPEILRFRRMAASSFDIACMTVINTSNVVAAMGFDTERFPEFSYSEYTNTPFMTSRDVVLVNPKEEKQFAIHFYPYNPLVTSFPLPMMINKIFCGSKSKTLLLPTVKVHAQVLSYKLEVRSWRYTFQYFPYFNYKNVTSQMITIKNPGKNVITFCIRLDELAAPFDFRYVGGVKSINYSCSYVIELQPDEYIIYEALYQPTATGNHSIKLPVFIRDDFTQDMHNYFYLVGTYPEATYKCTEDAVHLGFIPLKFSISKKIIIDMAYHHPSCNCTANISDLHTYIEIDNSRPTSTTFYKIISIIFNSSKTHLVNCKLYVSCHCPGPNFEVDVIGGCENNYFTVHQCIEYFKCTSSMSLTAIFEASDGEMNLSTITVQDIEKDESFKHSYKTDLPFFQSGTHLFDDYMRRIVTIYEKWLTEQVFFGVKSYTIPESICLPEIKLYEKQGKRDGIIRVPLQHVMNYLLGPALFANYEIKYSEKKPICWQIRRFYKDILGYLHTLGCTVSMIKPESLLTFEMYQEYLTYTEHTRNMLNAKSFYLLAKQCWLDLLLQAYKVLVSKRVLHTLTLTYLTLAKSERAHKVSSISSRDIPMSHHGGVCINSTNIFSDESVMLLLWVDRHFQEHKEKFVSPDSEVSLEFIRRRIENFDDDISDSLGFIACVLSHCAFMEEHISGIYAPAKNRREKISNAYILIKMLGLLHVSFHLEPNDIIEPDIIQILMFLTYLYDFLLPLRSHEAIVFNTVLSQTKEETLAILNDSKHKMYYNVIFFNNTNDLFAVEESQIVIEPDTIYKLNITYYARFLRIQKAIILLSGEIHGYQYTNSKIYYLEGHPDLANSQITPIELKCKIYKVTEVSFDIQSPYAEASLYDIFLVNQESNDVTEIIDNLIPYSKVLETGALVRCKFSSAYATADQDGKIIITAEMCNIINTSTSQRVLFRHMETGDFMVLLKLITKSTKRFNVLNLTMQKAVSEFPCTCPRRRPDVTNNKCPRSAKVLIPCRNEFLWTAVMQFFLATRDPEESEFWDIYGNTSVGSHIVERILYDHKRFLSDDMVYFMNKTFTYNVQTKKPEIVVTQKKKVIKEASSDTTTEILVHFNEIVKSFYLILESVDGKETRTYKVLVNYE